MVPVLTMTGSDWDAEWWIVFGRIRRLHGDWNIRRAQDEATGLMRLHYGARPTSPILAPIQTLGLGLLKGVAMDLLKKLFTGKPGLTRTIAALYIVAVVVLKALGLDSIAETVGVAVQWLGLLPAAMPVDPATAVAGILAAVALARQFVRWVIEGFKPAPPVA